MQEAELKYADRLKNGTPQNFADLLGSDSSKKRKRRTSFTPQALEVLNEAFERNTHPSGADMTLLANKLNNDREVIRVWFCNKRQALKNTIKKYKTGDISIQNDNSNGLVSSLTSGNGSQQQQTSTSIFVTNISSSNNNDSTTTTTNSLLSQQVTSQLDSVTGGASSSS